MKRSFVALLLAACAAGPVLAQEAAAPSVPVVALMAFLVFAEIPVIQMWIGAAVIISATVIATGGAARRKKPPVDEI